MATVIAPNGLRVPVSDELIQPITDPYALLSEISPYYLLIRQDTDDQYHLIPSWGIEMVESADINDHCFFAVEKSALRFKSPMTGTWGAHQNTKYKDGHIESSLTINISLSVSGEPLTISNKNMVRKPTTDHRKWQSRSVSKTILTEDGTLIGEITITTVEGSTRFRQKTHEVKMLPIELIVPFTTLIQKLGDNTQALVNILMEFVTDDESEPDVQPVTNQSNNQEGGIIPVNPVLDGNIYLN